MGIVCWCCLRIVPLTRNAPLAKPQSSASLISEWLLANSPIEKKILKLIEMANVFFVWTILYR